MREPDVPTSVLTRLRLPVLLTRGGMLAERVWRAFWPLFSILMVGLALAMLGVQDSLPIELIWGICVLVVLGAGWAVIRGARALHWPSRAEALERLDETLPGRPIQAVLDQQASGSDDPASQAVWQVHQARMAERAAQARPVQPDLRLARRDPFALRYVALLALVMAGLFGSVWRVASLQDIAPGAAQPLASGPSWEGWIEPPTYTGLPTIYLNDLTGDTAEIPQNSRIHLRFYGEVGALTLAETVSGRVGEIPSSADPEQNFVVTRDGTLSIKGPGGHDWAVQIIADTPPTVSTTAEVEVSAEGEMSMPYTAQDDYGIMGGEAVISLDHAALMRRYGLVAEPDPRDPISVDLPLPISGSRAFYTEPLVEDFSRHPWANLPVVVSLTVRDAASQAGGSEPVQMLLPGRRFFDPLAAAVIEQRRDLLWARSNAPRVAQMLRAISNRPEGVFRSETAYLRLRVILRRLERFSETGLLAEKQEEIAQALWDLAIILEEGDLGDALERLRRAQERLAEAMRNGASDQEIAELMQELRDATDDYMRQLSRQAEQQDGDEGQPDGETMQMTQDDLQRMMDRIQDLMEQGRMAEAQEALRQLQQRMEYMRVTQGQGQNGQSEGQRAMEGLADTLRNQQGLSDQAFRDLQEQFNPGARSGESDGNQGRNGGQGQGQSHEGEGGQGDGSEGSLGDRQQALREQLDQQRGNLPGAGTPDGDAAREALDRAGRAMERAEDALRSDDLAEAIDRQAEAMEALRDGMRSLGEAMAQDDRTSPGEEGDRRNSMRATGTDPLGRSTGPDGGSSQDGAEVPDEDVYRRARELLDEIRRRAGEAERPELELDYLRRLLDRF
jgi:uncharacterized protein (TIGR02302 family)